MNKKVISSLMIVVMFGLVFAGCQDGTTDNNNDTEEKVVEEKYRRRIGGSFYDLSFSKNEMSISDDYSREILFVVSPVWTIGNILYMTDENDVTKEVQIGTFFYNGTYPSLKLTYKPLCERDSEILGEEVEEILML